MKRLIRQLIWPFWSLGTKIVLLWSRTPAGKKLIVTEYPLYSESLPKEFDGFTIVHLTDLHGRCFENHQMELVEKVSSLQPDVVLLTGDMYDHYQDADTREPINYLFRQLSQRWPVYGILGNHEMRDPALRYIIEDMRNSGVRLLRNRAAFLRKGGAILGIAGVDTDAMKQMFDDENLQEHENKLRTAMARYQKEKPDYTILLAHKPELLEEYAKTNLDLVFSGHAHGGLMKIPFTGGRRLLAPGQGFLPRFTQGIYEKKGTTLVLSSGLGGPRLGLYPEIVKVQLYSAKMRK